MAASACLLERKRVDTSELSEWSMTGVNYHLADLSQASVRGRRHTPSTSDLPSTAGHRVYDGQRVQHNYLHMPLSSKKSPRALRKPLSKRFTVIQNQILCHVTKKQSKVWFAKQWHLWMQSSAAGGYIRYVRGQISPALMVWGDSP